MTVDLDTQGGLLDVPGFEATGVHAGLRTSRRDVALIVSEHPTTAAAVFTQNPFAAAPIQVTREHIAQQDVRAIVVNSANANACTGKQGLEHAYQMATHTAAQLGLEPHQVLVSSTGIIGRPLDIETVLEGITACADQLDDATGGEAAEAITTTDTVTKEVLATVTAQGRTFKVGGVAKGSGMIHPNMATMLGFLVTDAPVASEHLQTVLSEAVDATFNQISVDGDESTNDMVTLLANGVEGGPELAPGTPGFEAFSQGVHAVCQALARMIAGDGEGASKLLEVEVTGAASIADARLAARAIASSNLVKAALHGEDPNWGRIVAAIGSTRVPVDTGRLTIAFGSEQASAPVLELGQPLTNGHLQAGEQVLEASEVQVSVDLGVGSASAKAWGCDLTQAYVRFNSAYTT